jgi:hypothetical protein
VEARFVAYHLRSGGFDYFIQLVLHRPYDSGSGAYPYGYSEDDLQAAVEILSTFALLEEPGAASS